MGFSQVNQANLIGFDINAMVAESAALLGAQQATGQLSELAVNKIKNAQATCAIARSYSQSLNQAHSNPLEQQDQQSK